jgi:benzoyl-CoA reductase/2-hydroxyglutaryl-CoA dehydratase subunit BcrC/BadD/HgdB
MTQPVLPKAQFLQENSVYNRVWFQDVQRQVAEGGPFAFVNVDTPTEIFKAMGIPVVVNQWWSSICAAKGRGPDYLNALVESGYRKDLCSYCAMALGSVLADDPAKPWGGLPRPSILVTSNGCGSSRKIFEIWGAREGIPVVVLDHAVLDDPVRKPIARMRTDWEEMLGTRQIDFVTAQYRELIALLERQTGRAFDHEKFAEVMRLVNEQEEYYGRTRDLIAVTYPAPMNVIETMPATMIPQWHRGTQWGVDRARLFFEEAARRVDAGSAGCPDEKHRLAWIGRGLWHNLPFYRHFEQELGAVFAWSVYLAIASDGYPRYGGDPLRALAARMLGIFALVGDGPFVADWFVEEFRRAGINGVIRMGDDRGSCKPMFGRSYLFDALLEENGFPVLTISGDAVDPRCWDEAALTAQISDFIQDRLTPVAPKGNVHERA